MNRRDFLQRSSAAALAASLFGPGRLAGQTPPPNTPASPNPAPPARMPPLVTEFKPLRRNVGYFTGRGGTIGWLVNDTALAMVDTQFAEPAEAFLRDLPGRAGRPLDVVINTHHHGDHTSGNATVRPSAKTIVAHANVPELLRLRAEADQTTVNPATVPDATFADTWRMDLGDETVSARHFGPAHTRGDIVVLFEKANVVHMGDLMFNRLYPVIDRPGGAKIAGWIQILEKVATEYPADAHYIFGHGQAKFGVLGGPAELLVFRDYLSGLLAHTAAEIKAGKSKEEILKLENLPDFPDFHAPPGRGNRLPMNLSVAYDELTTSSA